MKDLIVRIMLEVLSALALARKQIKIGRFSAWSPQFVPWVYNSSSAEKFARKLLGESEVEAVLIRLERLTQEEARLTGAQILEVVHGLMKNVKVAMEGTRPCLFDLRHLTESLFGRQQSFHLWHKAGSR
jgi:hypothetical protein